ncbi:hypothetical protein ACC699_24340 [Rhizobium ruizarguesonis]
MTSSTIRAFSTQDGVEAAFKQWLQGSQFHEIHATLAAAGVRISNHGLKVEDVVALCESGFAYDAAMVIASIADLLEGETL